MNINLENSIIIWDESHNIDDKAISVFSAILLKT